MKKTDWYSGDQQPVRVGMYERKWDFDNEIQNRDFWDGKQWRAGVDGSPSPLNLLVPSNLAWRGLVGKSKGAA